MNEIIEPNKSSISKFMEIQRLEEYTKPLITQKKWKNSIGIFIVTYTKTQIAKSDF